MPIISMPGKYFSAASLKESGPKVLTIKDCQKKNVALESEPPEEKWVVMFEETEEGVALNRTRLDQLLALFGSLDSDVWKGQKVTVYCDPSVVHKGKKVGGVAFKEAPGLFTKPIKEL